jgi:hypothetical protein
VARHGRTDGGRAGASTAPLRKRPPQTLTGGRGFGPSFWAPHFDVLSAQKRLKTHYNADFKISRQPRQIALCALFILAMNLYGLLFICA